jgi:hypothetical protein
MTRGIACLVSALAFSSTLAALAVSATACEGGGGGGPELTTLSTKLSGEGKEGEELTVLEGSKVKDKATLSGKNASKATGKVTYTVYSESACKTPVAAAGEVTVSGEAVPASNEEELEGGASYYWQAHYSGDAKNAESTSACTEIATILPPAPRVEAIDFGGNEEILLDHTQSATHEEVKKLVGEGKAPEAAKSIEEVGGADKIEWKSPKAGEVTKNWPLAYPKETTMELVKTRFALEPKTRNFLKNKLESAVTVIGETKVSGVPIKFEQKITAKEAKEQMEGATPEYLEMPKVTASAALPKEVKYEAITITWKWKAKGVGGAAIEQGLGTSTHNLYMTYKKAVGGANYFTLLAETTEQIAKVSTKPTREQVISGTWNAFKNVPGIHVWIYNPASATGEIKQTTAVLWYYEEMPTKVKLPKVIEEEGKTLAVILAELPAPVFLNTAARLLEYLEGECGAWQNAFVRSLEVEGLEAASIELFVEFEANAENACEVARACGMLVKNWKFEGGKVGLNYAENEVEKLEGIAGEGIKTPSSFFGNHQVVEIKNEAEKVWEIYDPSYGTAPVSGTKKEEKRAFEAAPESKEARLKYQKEALAGFCREKAGAWACGEEANLALVFKKVAGPRPPASMAVLRVLESRAKREATAMLPRAAWLPDY